MSTIRHNVEAGAWTKITSEAAGSLFVERGGAVALTEAASTPAGAVENTPLLDVLNVQESKVYFNLSAGSYIYARALSKAATMTNTPAA